MAAVFLLNLIPSFNLMLHFAEASWWPLWVFRYLNEPFSLTAWTIAFLGLRSFDPPERLKPLDQELIGNQLQRNLQIAMDSL